MKLGQLSLQSIDFLNSAQKRITYQQRNKIQKRFYIHKIQKTQHSTLRLKKKGTWLMFLIQTPWSIFRVVVNKTNIKAHFLKCNLVRKATFVQFGKNTNYVNFINKNYYCSK